MIASRSYQMLVRSRLESSPGCLQSKSFSPYSRTTSRDRRHTQLHQFKRKLLRAALEETPDPRLFKRICGAANQAAALAWSTDEPVLFFPCLFEEQVRTIRGEMPEGINLGQSAPPQPEATAAQHRILCDHLPASGWPVRVQAHPGE